MSVIKCALIGYGYWGKILENNLMRRSDVSLETIVDSDKNLVASIKDVRAEIGINVSGNLADCREHDIAFVAVPPKEHLAVSKFLIDLDLDLWVEKPLAQNEFEATQLLEYAKLKNKLVYVDFPFLYDHGFEKIKDFCEKKIYGPLLHYQSRRMNLGIVQPDTDILHDLFVHDLSLLFSLGINEPFDGNFQMLTPGVGHSQLHNNPICQVVAKSIGPLPLTVNTTLGWVSHGKIRDHIFFFEKATVGWEPFKKEAPVSISESFIEWEDLGEQFLRAQYRKGQIIFPPVADSDPLQSAMDDFLLCHKNGDIQHPSSSVAMLAHKTNENLEQIRLG